MEYGNTSVDEDNNNEEIQGPSQMEKVFNNHVVKYPEFRFLFLTFLY